MKHNTRISILVLLASVMLASWGLMPVQAQGTTPQATPTTSPPPAKPHLYLPLIGQTFTPPAQTCAPIPNSQYHSLQVLPPPSDRPAVQHADLNLALRGYTAVEAERNLVWIDGPTDVLAPQLFTLFGDQRLAQFAGVYQVYDWDWNCNCRGAPLSSPEVTLAALAVTPGEILYAPESGYSLEDDYQALVLYADEQQLTLKYTREDNVVYGYTIHFSSLCVEPSLLALYRNLDEEGRAQLPALTKGQALGRARGDAILVAIRDSGRFMDPRSQKDWWRTHRWLF
ncbi:MAG: hypothetical protein GXP38_02485 [Chloroflexi bacterium]|nr:hypothetical protein [Chloroflexota bacterium]